MDIIDVVDWVPFDMGIHSNKFVMFNFGGWFGVNEDKQYRDKRCDFKVKHRWIDYINRLNIDNVEYVCSIRNSILEKYKSVYTASVHGGKYHQYADDGAPLFSNEKVGLFSRNAWGDLMSAIWTEKGIEDNIEEYNEHGIVTQYCYYDFK